MNTPIRKSVAKLMGLCSLVVFAHSSLANERQAESSDSLYRDWQTPESSQTIPAEGDEFKTKVYIVRFSEQPVMSYEGGVGDLAATKPQQDEKVDPGSKEVADYQAHLGGQHDYALDNCGVDKSNKIYQYSMAFNGMAVSMTEHQASLMRLEPNVLSVTLDKTLKLQSDSTREFLNLNKGRHSAWQRKYTGEDVIIGILDSGIDPEHPSFADVATPTGGDRGRLAAYRAPPSSWRGDACEFGNSEFNPNDLPFECNNKILGARFFVNGFLQQRTLAPGSSLSARDDDGHGSAAASIAAGNFGVQAVIDAENVGADTISGVAPRARIAVYKVCWEGPNIDGEGDPDDACISSDSMAAIDQAIADGVDVINFSIGNNVSTNFADPESIAFLFAAEAGVHVAVSAGNDGPIKGTLGSPSMVPWVTSVGAVNDNQNFASGVEVISPSNLAGLKTSLESVSAVQVADGAISGDLLVSAPANGCEEFSNAEAIDGQVALVIRGGCNFDTKFANAELAGASAIIVYNDGTEEGRQNPIVMNGVDSSRTIPGVMISFTDGDALANSEETRSVSLDELNQIPLVNRVADFSSRGVNRGSFDILKPDVVAPGVQILSAETTTESDSTEAATGDGVQTFQFISGTSFSSPHVAGTLALIKQAHPGWSPAMARSALMTSARQNLGVEFSDELATPFDIGAGHIVPNAAFEPGLAYDVSKEDYEAFTCENNFRNRGVTSDATCERLASERASLDGSDLNLPSIAIGSLVSKQTITRTVTNVDEPSSLFGYGNQRIRYGRFGSETKSIYDVVIDAPDGVDVEVSPKILELGAGESQTYEVTFSTTSNDNLLAFSFGSISWVERGKFNLSKYFGGRIGSRLGYGKPEDQFGFHQDPGRFPPSFLSRTVYSPLAIRTFPIDVPFRFSVTPDVNDPITGAAGTAEVDVQFGAQGDYTPSLLGFVRSGRVNGNVSTELPFGSICLNLPNLDHLRAQTFNEDSPTLNGNDLVLRVLRVDSCERGQQGEVTVLSRANRTASANEVIDFIDTEAGSYEFVVQLLSDQNASTDFVMWLSFISQDNGNASVTQAPETIDFDSNEKVVVSYEGLQPGFRHLGVLLHNVNGENVGRSVIDVNAR